MKDTSDGGPVRLGEGGPGVDGHHASGVGGPGDGADHGHADPSRCYGCRRGDRHRDPQGTVAQQGDRERQRLHKRQDADLERQVLRRPGEVHPRRDVRPGQPRYLGTGHRLNGRIGNDRRLHRRYARAGAEPRAQREQHATHRVRPAAGRSAARTPGDPLRGWIGRRHHPLHHHSAQPDEVQRHGRFRARLHAGRRSQLRVGRRGRRSDRGREARIPPKRLGSARRRIHRPGGLPDPGHHPGQRQLRRRLRDAGPPSIIRSAIRTTTTTIGSASRSRAICAAAPPTARATTIISSCHP